MPAAVPLQDIVDALQGQMDDALSFVNVDTGEVIANMPRHVMGLAEESGEDEEVPDDVDDDEWERAREIAGSDRYQRLPTAFDIHEWEIMREFAESVEQGGIRRELFGAVRGSGAFRHFKSTIRRHGIEPAWWEFRDRALREIAIAWCEENEIRWE